TNNLQSYASYIDTNAGFCNDRTPYQKNASTNYQFVEGLGGYGTAFTAYGSGYRLNILGGAGASLGCKDNDLFTVSTANHGNKSMTYPIGVITADEVSMAGGVVNKNNTSYYLYRGGGESWTMSPRDYGQFSDTIIMLYLSETGSLGVGIATTEIGMRPVINLKAGSNITGSGTGTDPYVVVGTV
ncbi:MAG: hypothetical protein K2J20_03190, partial [Bacilli bacterium]|nr:hypothetical protein [Bacilli bacterium]